MSNIDTYFTYDANGALSEMIEGTATTYFTYGPNQLITSITPPSGSADAWTFDYDGQLNRYKIVKGTLGTRYLLWDGLSCMEERDASNILVARYTYGYTPIYGIASNVEIYIPGSSPPTTAKTYTLAMDHRGTANVLLAGTTAVGWRQYNAFGEIISQTGTWPVDLGYQTNWQTVQIGSKMWGLSAARLYDFQTGRFTQRDLKSQFTKLGYDLKTKMNGVRKFSNSYIYVNNSIVYKIDILGLDEYDKNPTPPTSLPAPVSDVNGDPDGDGCGEREQDEDANGLPDPTKCSWSHAGAAEGAMRPLQGPLVCTSGKSGTTCNESRYPILILKNYTPKGHSVKTTVTIYHCSCHCAVPKAQNPAPAKEVDCDVIDCHPNK